MVFTPLFLRPRRQEINPTVSLIGGPDGSDFVRIFDHG
jgi:hypothetical protein